MKYILADVLIGDDIWYDPDDNPLSVEQVELMRQAARKYYRQELDDCAFVPMTPRDKEMIDEWRAATTEEFIRVLGFKPHFYYDEVE